MWLGELADGIDIDIENKCLALKLRETATQLRERFLSDPRFSAEIWVAANFGAGRQKLVTYCNYKGFDVSDDDLCGACDACDVVEELRV